MKHYKLLKKIQEKINYSKKNVIFNKLFLQTDKSFNYLCNEL